MENKKWFESWFNTSYYHILYKNRDYSEAEYFIDNLINLLQPKKKSTFLDLACGRGRHAIYLNSKGFETTGVDLSEQSILFAKEFENDMLKFQVLDMRLPFQKEVDYIFNLFTSFGYFETKSEDEKVIKSVYKTLKKDGVFVLDYLNTKKYATETLPNEIKIEDGITFNISKEIIDNKLIKEISFIDNNIEYHFKEQVRCYFLQELTEIMKKNKFKICNIFGDYALNPFDEFKSERLILVVKKLS